MFSFALYFTSTGLNQGQPLLSITVPFSGFTFPPEKWFVLEESRTDCHLESQGDGRRYVEEPVECRELVQFRVKSDEV
jgi:hypothetical protein